jgi:hypothetical protein
MVMPSAHAYVQEISINGIRKQVARALRGSMVLFTPVLALIPLFQSFARDLPRFDAAELVSPKLWVLIGLSALSIAAMRACRFDRFICKRCVGGLIALQTLLLLGVVFGAIDLIGRTTEDMIMDAVAGFLLLGLLVYWLVLSPALAAIRLLATRLPPDDVPLLAAMATLEQTRTRPQTLPSPLTRIVARAKALRLIAYLPGLAAGGTFLWLLAQAQMFGALASLALVFGSIYVITLVSRRAQRLAAIGASEQLKQDSRAPVLYLRSFQDDSELLEMETDILVQTRSGAPSALEKSGVLAQAWRQITRVRALTSGGRLEELLANEVRGIGPFVTIGEPTEPLPELGAARAYFCNDTWQSAIIRWVDLAGLIIKVIGPTKWIRWELDTIIERDALSKLIILMPPGWPADRAARWQNVVSGLQSTRWGSSLAMVDSETVIAIGFFDDGGLSIVKGGKRRNIDYLLAFRLVLYQLKESAGLNQLRKPDFVRV